MTRSLVLLSGGLDSSVNTYLAKSMSEIAFALTFDYGQLSAVREIEASLRIVEYYGIPFKHVELPWLGEITGTALCNRGTGLPRFDSLSTNKAEDFKGSAQQVWVPNRNGIFINIAAAFAESFDIDLIITGFNREEGETFPDNSEEFINVVNDSLSFSTLKKCRVHSYTSGLQKKDIVKLGLDGNFPFHLIYSCYSGDEKMCGRCESCMRTIKAFEENSCFDLIKGNFRDEN